MAELAFWLALALVALALSFQFSDEVGAYRWGAASWPRAVILLMAVTAIIQAVIRLREESSKDPAIDHVERRGLNASLGLFLIPLVYVLLMPRTGFYLTTPVFLAISLVYAGERRWQVIAITTLLITGLVLLVFAKLFYVALPIGYWLGFYDLNNWLLVMIR